MKDEIAESRRTVPESYSEDAIHKRMDEPQDVMETIANSDDVSECDLDHQQERTMYNGNS